MKTFLECTLHQLEEYGYKSEDVLYVQSLDGLYKTGWEDFKLKSDVTFNSDYKSRRELLNALVIHLNDGSWMQTMTSEFQGRMLEYWCLRKKPKLNLFDCVHMDKFLDSIDTEVDHE